MARCKITVLKKTVNQDLIDEYITDEVKQQGFGACTIFETGEKFYPEDFASIPPGFCPWAWADIREELFAIGLGGDAPWMKDKGTILSCCTDALRPVIFKIERIEEEA